MFIKHKHLFIIAHISYISRERTFVVYRQLLYNKMSLEEYSIPSEAAELLRKGILENPLLASNIPSNGRALAAFVKYVGGEKPSLPVNWRFAESISALKGLEALWLNAMLKSKYDHEPVNIEINT